MADTKTKEERSKNMSRIRSKNTSIEIKVRKYLFSKGFRFRVNDKRYEGHPDIVMPKYKTIIFIHGCFWHKHDCPRFVWPSTNTDYWYPKIMNNVNRDQEIQKKLISKGWNVIIVWECQLKDDNFAITMEHLVNHIVNEKQT